MKVKDPHNKYTSKFGKGVLMGSYGLHSVLINGRQCDIRNHDGESSERETVIECINSGSSEWKMAVERKYSRSQNE